MISVKIYTLTNPLNNEIFYVGKTQEPRLNARLIVHICEARRHPTTSKNIIINEILKCGHKPIIELIEAIPIEGHGWQPIWDSQRIESYWISQFMAWGFKLTNQRHNPNISSTEIHNRNKYVSNE